MMLVTKRKYTTGVNTLIASFLWCWHVPFQFDSVLSTHKNMNEMKSMRCICQTFADGGEGTASPSGADAAREKRETWGRGFTRKPRAHGKSRNATQTLTSASRHHTPKVTLIPEFYTLNTSCSFFVPPPSPPLPYRVVFGMVILTQIAIDRWQYEMNWSQDVLTRAVVHFRTTNAAACLRSRGFRSTLVSSSLAVCAMTAEQLSG